MLRWLPTQSGRCCVCVVCGECWCGLSRVVSTVTYGLSMLGDGMCVSTPTMCVCEVWYVSLHPHYVSLHPHYVCREYVLTTHDKPLQHSPHTTHTQHLHTRRWYVSLQPHYMCVRYGMCLSTPPLLSQTQRVPMSLVSAPLPVGAAT
jgi:hypothetical protein